MSSLSCPKQSLAIYRPRRPEKTVLFEVIKKHYNTFFKNSKEPIPKYVDKEFRKFLECGILAKGFACAHCNSCQKDFLIAFSCKGRGLCPTCNTRFMVATAAHIVENIIPAVPIRQFVISFPMRIRHYLQTHSILQTVLRIVVDEIRKGIIAYSADIPNAQVGIISFIQHFGKTLNTHPHFHLVAADGIFTKKDEQLQFHEAFLTPDDIKDIQNSIRDRVLRYFGRRRWFDEETIEKMRNNENSGFSLDASVRIPSWDRQGLERLIRYCARPCFAGENLRWNGPWLIYRLPKRTHTGKFFIQMEPNEFLEKISVLIPYPRRHRHHYHGIFAPNAKLRKKLVATVPKQPKRLSAIDKETTDKVEKVSLNWRQLIARIYEVDPLICRCGKEMKIIKFVTHPTEIRRILLGLGWPTEIPEFDPPMDLFCYEVCQLMSGTMDGFSDIESPDKIGPDPPYLESYCDPPHWDDHSDPPHWED